MNHHLLSLHPKWAELTAAGRKRCELRKARIRGMRPGSMVWLYATLPIGKIICGAIVSTKFRYRRDFIEKAFDRGDLGRDLAMNLDEFRDYAGDYDGVFTIVRWSTIYTPKKPFALPKGLAAPQFYKKLDSETGDEIFRNAELYSTQYYRTRDQHRLPAKFQLM